MKKQGLKIWLTITLALIMLISSFAYMNLPVMYDRSTMTVENCAFAENETVSYSLVPANYYTDPDRQEKYNLGADNLDSFTPFDFESAVRMPGDAFKFEEDENHQIIDQYVKLDYHNEIVWNDSLSLVFWVYIDGINLHNLEIVLEFENGSTLTYNLSRSELQTMLIKESQSSGLSSNPYAYNKFNLPLNKGDMYGEIKNGDVLFAPTKLIVNYKSTISEEQQNLTFASLYFYDVKLETVDSVDIAVTEKQDYFISSFNHISEEISSNICVGDQYKIPLLQDVVNYAFKGKENLLEGHKYTWRVRVSIPDDDNTVKTMAFNDTITFELEGIYKIYYECVHSEEASVIVDLYSRDFVTVNSFNPIYFSKQNIKVDVGTSYVLGIGTSALFTEISDITFEYDQNALDVKFDDNGDVVLSSKKDGSFKVIAKVNGKRMLNPNLQEYQCELAVVSRNVSQNNLAYRIFLYVVIALIGALILISIIILLVKSRKVVVK